MTGNQMVFNYAQHHLIYSHDIKSYYHWLVLKTLGKTVVSLIWCTTQFAEDLNTMWKYHEDLDMLHSSNVHLYVFIEFTFDMDPLCIVHVHGFLLLSMGISTLGRYCIFGKFPCLTCRCFFDSYVHKLLFSIIPWLLKSISPKSIRIKENSMYFSP